MRPSSEGTFAHAVSLDGRELRLRRGDPVSPLGAGFVAGPDEDSDELGSEFEDPDVKEESSEGTEHHPPNPQV